MNRKITGRLGAVALVLTLVSMSFVGGTLAKYTMDVTAASQTISLGDLFKSTYGNGTEVSAADLAVAPGTSGNTKITLSNDGEVAIQPTFTIAQTNAGNVPMEYAVTTEATAPATDSEWKSNTADLSITQAAIATGADQTFYLHWRWKSTTDEADTAFGVKAALDTVKLDLTCTVEQVAPTAAPAP